MGTTPTSPTAPAPTAPTLCGSPSFDAVIAVDLPTDPPTLPPDVDLGGGGGVILVDLPTDPPAPTPPSLAPVSPAPTFTKTVPPVTRPTLGPRVRRPGFPVWWDLVAPNFIGNNLKRCYKRNDTPPEQGSRCALRPKTCYFQTQECPGLGASPLIRCVCDARIWECLPVRCTIPEAPLFE